MKRWGRGDAGGVDHLGDRAKLGGRVGQCLDLGPAELGIGLVPFNPATPSPSSTSRIGVATGTISSRPSCSVICSG